MRERNIFFVIGLAIAVLVMSACAPVQPQQAPEKAAPEAEEQEPIEFVFRQNDPPSQIGEGLQNAVDAWNADNPNIQVTFETVPWSDAQKQYVREVQAGGGPDVLQLAFVWTRDLAKSDLVMNLDPFIEQSPPGKGMDDFLGVDLAVYEDSIFGIPWSVDTFALGYRPDIFEEAGIGEFPETWEDFKVAAQKLTADTDGDGRTDQYGFCFQGGSGSTGGMWFLANYYLWSHGKWFVQEAEGGGWEVGLTADDVAGAMQYFNSFFEEGYTPESMIAIDSWGDPEYVSALGRGECAILFLPPAAFEAARERSDATVRSAPDPRGPAGRISHLGGRHLSINPNTEHPEEAWEFLRYLTTKGFYEEYYSSYFPPQKSLLEAIEFPEHLQGYAEQLPHAITFKTYIVSPARVSTMWEATNREFGSVYSGQKAPEQASLDLVAKVEEALTREGQ